MYSSGTAMQRKVAVLASVALLMSAITLLFSASPAHAQPIPIGWESTGGGSDFVAVNAFAYDIRNDKLYTATAGRGVWRCDNPASPSSSWTDLGIDAEAQHVNSLAYDGVHDVLYAGTQRGLRRCANPRAATPTWTEPDGALIGCEINAMVYDPLHDILYAGWFDGGSARYMGLWRCGNPRDDTLQWTDTGSSDGPGGGRIDSLAYDPIRNLIYAGCTAVDVLHSVEEGKGVWRCDNPDTTPTWQSLGGTTVASSTVLELVWDQLNNLLFVGTSGSGIWRCDNPEGAPAWTDLGGSFGAADIEGLAYDPNNDALFAGGDFGGVWQCTAPGSAPEWSNTGGAVSGFAVHELFLDPLQFALFADCSDAGTGTKEDVYWASVVPESIWYFAEGYTGSGFQEYLCLGNPNEEDLVAKVTYMFSEGTSLTRHYNVPALSRYTVNVNSEVGENREVSLLITSRSVGLIAERPMYFDYTGAGEHWNGGHDAVGALTAATNWYFAEGYTGYGFDEWICVLNPGTETADLTFRFQTQEEGEKTVTGLSVPPFTRSSFKANNLLEGKSYQTSLALESTTPVVAERPMYFKYQGTNRWNWTGGHCVMGVPFLTNEYFFAEGCTRAGFEEWLTIQNPHDHPITVEAIYNLREGEPVRRTYNVPARWRFTVLVNGPEGVGPEQDVSVHLSSTDTFLAERPMYFSYPGLANHGWTGGHCVIGAIMPWDFWFLAEGYTGTDFEEWICIQNPGLVEAQVTVTYLVEGSDPIITHHSVGSRSRYTIMVNQDAGPDLAISAMIASDQPVIVERPMYFSYGLGGWTGGHDVVGHAEF